jgi:tetratricopeptide (TPR) repeat protein
MDAAAPPQTASTVTEAECLKVLAELRPLLASPTGQASGRFRDALSELLEVDQATPALVECLLLIAQYFYLANQPATGLTAAKAATAHARQLDNIPILVRRALSTEGIMRKETGDLPGSTQAFADALEIARAVGAPDGEGAVWNNLGVALMSSAQYMDALKCFERAASLARGSTQHPDV